MPLPRLPRRAPARLTLLLLVWLSTLSDKALAEVVSETLMFLNPDARSYLLQRALRSDAPRHRFYVDKGTQLEDFVYIDPNQYEWIDSAAEANTLGFAQGDFVVMYPGRIPETQLRHQTDGTHVYDSWDGKTRADGHFGSWYAPGDFDRFVHAWILPPNLELVDYRSNREGEWVKRNNALTFFAEQVNDLTFTIRFRDKDGDGLADSRDRCPGTATGITIGDDGCEPDRDGDEIADGIDACPDSQRGVLVDRVGCELDVDTDGVLDHLDRCPETPTGHAVDGRGCPLDSDGDRVTDGLDQCPGTDPSARVDSQGCELDSDADGVVDRLDRCASTHGDTSVDEHGCETDQDNDGVLDRRDACADTPSGAVVDRAGCETDCDGDGVVNSLDRCPRTALDTGVDPHGCPLDGDADGAPDGADRCPETPAGSAVDAGGCELDADADGIVDRLDHCPATPTGLVVDDRGCPFDSDADGVLDKRDLCPGTVAGTQVDATGCAVTAPIRLEGVNFHTNSAELTGESEHILDAVAATLAAHPALRLEVAGHTDSSGNNALNMALSRGRAESVRAYLIGQGVDAANLTARGYGQERPVAGNDSAEGRAANRRVELHRRGKSR